MGIENSIRAWEGGNPDISEIRKYNIWRGKFFTWSAALSPSAQSISKDYLWLTLLFSSSPGILLVQAIMVRDFGWTISRAERQSFHNLDNRVWKMRSLFRSLGRVVFRCSTAKCRRKANSSETQLDRSVNITLKIALIIQQMFNLPSLFSFGKANNRSKWRFAQDS